jgi:hypothetical protein
MHSDSAQRCARAALAAARLCCAGAGAAPALAEPVPEPDMKAAVGFNFTVFTEWPQDALAAGEPIRLCANPGAPLFAALNRLAEKVVNGHKLAVVRQPVSNLRSCHVLVLGSAERERWTQIRRELAGAHVLTVSDDSAISDDGAVIGMSVDNARIGFDVDMAAARGARLTLSSKLLRLARSVQ